MKSRIGFYGQLKRVKLYMLHCVMITKNGVLKNVDIKHKIVQLKY